MKRLHIHIIKWLANKFGYKIAMIKIGKGKVNLEGDRELLKYVDISSYSHKSGKIKPFSVKELKNLDLN